MKIKARNKKEIAVGIKHCNTCKQNIRCAECVYSNEEQSIDNALQVLIGYCNKHAKCDNCRFYNKDSTECMFGLGYVPCDWQDTLRGAEND